MDSVLLQRAYNCYLTYLDRLAYGRTDQDFCLLYGGIQVLANKMEERYAQFFRENLLCPERYDLDIVDDANKFILWTLNASPQLEEFTWSEIAAPVDGWYTLTTNSISGFNFLYLALPKDKKVKIQNELNVTVYDSELSPNNGNQLFSFIGTITKHGVTNDVYRKDDVFNSTNEVTFKIKLY